jgi:hypothetical protein
MHRAGHGYAFPPLYVKNTGTVPSSYSIRVERLSLGRQHAVPATWVQLQPNRLHLAPGKIARVAVTVTVPDGASSGSYLTDLVATTYAPHKPGAPALGAAAADKVTFDVQSHSGFLFWIVGLEGAALVGGLLLALRYRRGHGLTINQRAEHAPA